MLELEKREPTVLQKERTLWDLEGFVIRVGLAGAGWPQVSLSLKERRQGGPGGGGQTPLQQRRRLWKQEGLGARAQRSQCPERPHWELQLAGMLPQQEALGVRAQVVKFWGLGLGALHKTSWCLGWLVWEGEWLDLGPGGSAPVGGGAVSRAGPAPAPGLPAGTCLPQPSQEDSQASSPLYLHLPSGRMSPPLYPPLPSGGPSSPLYPPLHSRRMSPPLYPSPPSGGMSPPLS